jgi:hypothetical protein
MNKKKFSILGMVLAIIITGAVVAGAMTMFGTKVEEDKDLMMPQAAAVKFNCEKSGGTFDSYCQCPTSGVNESVYEAETGYCITAYGTPAGEMGETAKKLLEFEMSR